MEVCGGQTHSILQFGIEELLDKRINLVHGPGCPVCVTPVCQIDQAIAIASTSGVIFSTFGDMMRVPGSSMDLLTAKALGADVRMIYSPLDSVRIAVENPDRKVVFFAVGFETTAPANAMAVYQAQRLGLTNFSILCAHVTVPQVCANLLADPQCLVNGFLGPGHVCTVMGYKQYEPLAKKYQVPIVITGFGPVDLLEGILLCIKSLEKNQYGVINQYSRVVNREGNKEAQALLADVFSPGDRQWRGLGLIPESGYRLSEKYKQFDAATIFDTRDVDYEESLLCISAEILKGQKKPTDCPAFNKGCSPDTPLGATMVSSEGTCANYFKFKRGEDANLRN
ncbi:MAG: hydrogenase formation protein HypD, partial [Candidatus Obscuribacterales bacterium]|nr:hydrogenase formation protein HypD [Candidatus Obscuribacterales bacterium]